MSERSIPLSRVALRLERPVLICRRRATNAGPDVNLLADNKVHE